MASSSCDVELAPHIAAALVTCAHQNARDHALTALSARARAGPIPAPAPARGTQGRNGAAAPLPAVSRTQASTPGSAHRLLTKAAASSASATEAGASAASPAAATAVRTGSISTAAGHATCFGTAPSAPAATT